MTAATSERHRLYRLGVRPLRTPPSGGTRARRRLLPDGRPERVGVARRQAISGSSTAHLRASPGVAGPGWQASAHGTPRHGRAGQSSGRASASARVSADRLCLTRYARLPRVDCSDQTTGRTYEATPICSPAWTITRRRRSRRPPQAAAAGTARGRARRATTAR